MSVLGAQRLHAGTYRCPRCGATYTALGHETAAICDGGGKHRATAMTRVIDVTNDESER